MVPSPPLKRSHDDAAGEEDTSRLKGWVSAHTGWKTLSSQKPTPWLCPHLPFTTQQDQGARSLVRRDVGQSRTNYLWSGQLLCSNLTENQTALFRWLTVRQDTSHMWHAPRHHQPKFNMLWGAKGIAVFWLPVKSHAAAIQRWVFAPEASQAASWVPSPQQNGSVSTSSPLEPSDPLGTQHTESLLMQQLKPCSKCRSAPLNKPRWLQNANTNATPHGLDLAHNKRWVGMMRPCAATAHNTPQGHMEQLPPRCKVPLESLCYQSFYQIAAQKVGRLQGVHPTNCWGMTQRGKRCSLRTLLQMLQ